MNIIPAIDILEGKCVRLQQGNYAQKTVYGENPLEIALQFESAGMERLHLVDLDGARSNHIVNHAVLKEIASNTSLNIDFGGGIKSDEDIKIAFENGACQVTAGSIAVKSPETVARWLQVFGADKIILGADVIEGQIAIQGWQENSRLDLFEFLESYVQLGAQQVVCTDVSKDGMMSGPAFALYARILGLFPELKLIASGGISSIEDLDQLTELGLYGAIIGRAIYEGNIDLKKLGKQL